MKIYNKVLAVMLLTMLAFSMMACGTDDENTGNGSDVTDALETGEESEAEEVSNADNSETVTADESVGDTDADNVSYGELAEGDEAPDFAADLVDGGRFALSENEGKVVLLNFWATWCGPCVEEMPAFEKLDIEYGDEVAILGVNCVESADTVDAFVKDNNYTFPVAYDPEGSICNKYPTQGIPYTLVIGKDGKITNIYMGSMGMEQQYELYKSAIDAALSE